MLVYDIDSQALRHSLTAPEDVSGFAFASAVSVSGDFLAVGPAASGGAEGPVSLHDLRTWALLLSINGPVPGSIFFSHTVSLSGMPLRRAPVGTARAMSTT